MTDDAEAGRRVLADGLAAARELFGGRLAAAYALGSLAHGGFSPLVSDVDLALVLTDPVRPGDAEAVAAVAEAARAGGTDLHRRLSVFWGSPVTLAAGEGGRFPPLDRLDLIENGALLHGTDVRPGLPAPTHAELVRAGAEFALDFLGPGLPAPGAPGLGSLPAEGSRVLGEVLDPARLDLADARHVTKVVLFPARFLFTGGTGRVGTNELAAEHHRGRPGDGLVDAALRWRTGGVRPAAAAADLLARQLRPLYVHYVDDHIGRLEGLGETRLAAGFRNWRQELGM